MEGRRRSGGLTLVGVCFLVVLTGRTVYATVSAPTVETSALPKVRVAQTTSSPYGRPKKLGSLGDLSITESSGLIASRLNPGMLWTHNDSGDYDPYLYCLRMDATSCGRWSLGDVDPLDWEDIATGPGPLEGVSYLYLGDIGDNALARGGVTVHVVPEPLVGEEGEGGTLEAMTAIELTYPDGPHDAETLLVHPVSGDLYIVTKGPGTRAKVFKADAPLAPKMELVEIASFEIADNFPALTAGDISPNGKRVVFSTYIAAYEKKVPTAGGFDAVWGAPTTKVDVGPTTLREGIAYSLGGRTILTTSEGAGSALMAVRRK